MNTPRYPRLTGNELLYSIMNTFGNWLEQEINERGWSQAELARKATSSRTSINNIINGRRDPGPEMCRAIANALNLPQEYIFKKAGLIDVDNGEEDTSPTLEEANELMEQLPEEYQQQALALIRFLYETHAPYNAKKSESKA